MVKSISIIIASKNREDYIRNLLTDLNNQSIQAQEVLIIDQSERPYIFDEYDNIHHIIDNHTGPCHARNLGLERSSGEIIVFLDDDIRIETDFLETLCSPINNGVCLAVVGAMCDPDGQYSSSTNDTWNKEYANWLLALTANPCFPGQSTTLSFTTCCSAIHRNVYHQIGGFDPFFDPNGAGEDREYGLRILKAGHNILYQGKACVRHLGAPSGGRRGIGMGFKYQNILEANSAYIIAKHFGWRVFEDFCGSWLRSILRRARGLNPMLWGRSFLWCLETRKYISDIRKIKLEKHW